MNRLTSLVIAGLVVSVGWPPLGARLPIAGARLLGAQGTGAGAASADTDSDDDKDSDTDQDDGGDHAVMNRSHGSDAERTVEVSRMARPGRDTTTPLHVDIAYGMGSLSLAPIDGPWLYDVRLNYLPSHDMPDITYDTASHSLRVSASKHGDDINVNFGDHPGHDHGDEDLRVSLGKHVPLQLAMHFGAGDATAQLGGLSVQDLTMETGAADVTLSFNTPNPVTMDNMDLKVGAARFQATGLGNAHVRRVLVRAAAGDVDLDFAGRWDGDATLDLKAAIGAVHVHVPRGVLVDMSASGGKAIIGSVENNAQGTTTPQLPGGPLYHLHINSTAALGSIDIDRKTKD